ncbi:MAG: YggT family protein [Chloroflexi bacterium]|nr:YggT family protein [Chloroflexota bacterium]
MDGNIIVTFIRILVNVLWFALLARVVLSWIKLSPTNPLVVIVFQITEPMLAPIRRVLPRMAMIDLSPMVALIIIIVIQRLLLRIL